MGGREWGRQVECQNLVQGISWPFHPVLCVIPRTKPGQCIKAPVLPAKTPVPRARLCPAGASSRMCNWGTLEATDMTNGRNRKCIFFIHRQHKISGDIADKFKSCHRNLNVNSFCFPIYKESGKNPNTSIQTWSFNTVIKDRTKLSHCLEKLGDRESYTRLVLQTNLPHMQPWKQYSKTYVNHF